MSDQIGRHDASGPLARDADGHVDPEGYVRSALQGRELALAHAVLALLYAVVALIRGFGWPGGVVALAVLIIADLLIVGAVRMFQWYREERRRRAGEWPSWRAQLFVLQARTQGFAIPRSIRDDTRLAGRLEDAGDHWRWTPGRGARAELVEPIVLTAGSAPRITERIGSHGIATFDPPAGDARRLDFWVSRRRDLTRHLSRAR